MSLDPVWNEGWIVASHALAAMLAVIIGGVQFAMPKGTPGHRIMGYVWVVLILFVSVGSFWIHSLRVIGAFSPIHILSVITIVTALWAVRSARVGAIQDHRWAMITLFGLALIVTGLFTLLPGRAMHAVMFGPATG